MWRDERDKLREDKTEYLRNNRDYSYLLEDEEGCHFQPQQSSARQIRASDNDVSQDRKLYLSRREKLKELERQKIGKSGLNHGIRELDLMDRSKGKMGNNFLHRPTSTSKDKKILPYDRTFGSFFGPSEPVVAKRIIEEYRAREEAQTINARVARQQKEHRTTNTAGAGTSKSTTGGKSSGNIPTKISRPADPVKLKVQHLKEARDYSFLFSDEEPTMDVKKQSQKHDQKPAQSVSRKASVPHSQGNKKGNFPTKEANRNGSNPATSSMKSAKGHPQSMPKSSKTEKRFPETSSSRPSGSPQMPKSSKIDVSGRRPMHENHKNVDSRKIIEKSSEGKKTANGDQRRQMPYDASMKQRIEAKQSAIQGKSSAVVQGRPVSSLKGNVSAPGQRKPVIPAVGLKPISRPNDSGRLASTKSNLGTVNPQKRRADWDTHSEDSFIDDDDSPADYQSAIRRMFGYNPSKYADEDFDDREMEADFHSIEREERRSAKIAREEDERELALIEEEERRERLRKAKKLKR